MVYKVETIGKKLLVKDDREINDCLIFLNRITKFRILMRILNPNVKIYRYLNNKWDIVFNFPYRKLLK